MTCDKDMFLSLKRERYGLVSFGNDNSARIIRRGTIKIGSKDSKEENVLLVEDMKHNLLNVIQMCDQVQKLAFDSHKCDIRNVDSGRLVAYAMRTPRNIYVLSEIGKEKCCLGKEDEVWLWNRRMGYINFDNIVNINKKEDVIVMPQIMNPTNTLCKHCQKRNKTKTNFKTREYSTIRSLEIVHNDLVGPPRKKGLKGENYFMLLVDDYKRLNLVFFLRKKSEAFNNFKMYKDMVENQIDSKIKCLRLENEGEFTSKEFMEFCSEHGIKR
jgi:hypothetical protein